jgi:hypothetical protein
MRGRRKRGLPQEVFLSHSSKDRIVAERIAAVLRGHGVPVWYSESNLIGAQQWHDEIGQALERCDWFLIILSPQAIRSIWVKRELVYALRTPRYEDRIIPIHYRACESDKLSFTLAGFQSVNLIMDFDAGCRALLRAWGLGYDSGK